jgi:hypothetical protein
MQYLKSRGQYFGEYCAFNKGQVFQLKPIICIRLLLYPVIKHKGLCFNEFYQPKIFMIWV